MAAIIGPIVARDEAESMLIKSANRTIQVRLTQTSSDKTQPDGQVLTRPNSTLTRTNPNLTRPHPNLTPPNPDPIIPKTDLIETKLDRTGP